MLGPIATVRAVLPDMLARKAGSILFTSAASAQRPLIMTAPFGITAGALLNYTRILNRDLQADGIYAGFVAIAGIVVPSGKEEADNAAHFPPDVPRIRSDEIADLHWHPFELHPGAPPEGFRLEDYFRARGIADLADVRKAFSVPEDEARASGLELDLSQQPYIYRTVQAHTLLRHARGLATQHGLSMALMKAFFFDRLNVSDKDVFSRIAVSTALLLRRRAGRWLTGRNKRRPSGRSQSHAPRVCDRCRPSTLAASSWTAARRIR
ncbi:SDR family NAD(P)-dependent oxidoreductase [Methylocapsa polymorpha]|uniref:SDR family NAD(P)-dependent oxidoreductase n=1 Tax=Methylocapsa polymorpha TaxID=3080828 RepID=A0ABZ0HQ38_9HYPH|nr:SDR family NAD(P)-dependent oxidoreductase [Methylocapsa sp. RX1]